MIVTLEKDPETGDLMLPLPEELLKEVGWKTGDVLKWIDNNDGTYTLRKKTMPRFTFICEHDAEQLGGYQSDYRRNEVTFQAESWSDVLLEVDTFLRGSGFYFDGEVGMIEPEEKQEDTYDIYGTDTDDTDTFTFSDFECPKPEPIWNFQPLEEAIRRMKEQHSEHYYDSERNK